MRRRRKPLTRALFVRLIQRANPQWFGKGALKRKVKRESR